MITEDYVSFELAKLLKEKGFDEPCYCMYRIITKGKIEHLSNKVTNSDLNELYANIEFGTLPTLQMVMKWLREVHDTFISVEPGAIFGMFDVYVYYDNYTKLRIIERNKDNYEEACEAAIKYCLENLI